MWEVALTSSNEDQVVHLWEIRTGTILYSYKANKAATNSISLIGSDYFLSAQDKASFQIYTWHKDHPIIRSSIPEKVGAVCVSHDGLFCVAGGISGSCYIWEVSTGHLLRIWSSHYSKVTTLAFTGDGSYLVSGGEDGMVHVWALTTILDKRTNAVGEAAHVAPYRTFSNHTLPITSLSCGFGSLNTRIFSSSLDRSVKIWEISGNRLLGQVVLPSYASCAVVNPLETSLFVGGGDGNIYQVDIINCVEGGLTNTTKVFKGHSKPVHALSTSFDGTQLVSAGADGKCIVWDIHSRLPLRQMISHKGPVTNLITMLNPLQNEQAPPKIPMKSLQKFLQFDDASTKSSSELKLVPVDLGREPEAKAGRAQKRRKRESGRGRVDLANEGMFEDISVLINDKGSAGTLAKLQTEVEDLTGLNSRWQQVSSRLFEKCEAQLLKDIVS